MTDVLATDRVHRAVTDDGIEIVGRVVGEGPPLVLVHGALADGDSEWSELLPHLTDRFTCYLPSTRWRGDSGRHPDLTRRARVRDITAFVDSIGTPVRLVGASGGGMLSLGVAASTDMVLSVAALEPPVAEVLVDPFRTQFRNAVENIAAAARGRRFADAAKTFLDEVGNNEEIAAFSADAAALEELAVYLPIDIEEFREVLEPDGWSPTSPEVLARITAPLLLVLGTQTGRPWFTEGVHHVADHVPHAIVREIEGNGHLGHFLHPQRVADALLGFFDEHD